MDRRGFIAGLVGSGVATALEGCRLSALVSDRPEAAAGALRALRVDHDLCIGCRLCEDVCHGRSIAPGGRDRSRIHVHAFVPGPYHVAWACLGCPDVPCVRACDYYSDPIAHKKALHIDPVSGALRLDRRACAGCERCIDACERHGGGVLLWDDVEYVSGACDLCEGSPLCGAVCPVSAISVVEVDRRARLELRTPDAVARQGMDRACGRQAEELRRVRQERLRALRVDLDRCTGCRLCEAACDEKNNPRVEDGIALPGPGDVTRSLVRVHEFPGPYAVPWACLGCPDLPCVAACRAEAYGESYGRALHLDPESGAVRHDPAHCTACQACIEACERRGGGVLAWRPEQRAVVGACHLCGGDPACVRACPFGAIKMVEVDRLSPVKARRPVDAATLGAEWIYGRGWRP